jgi:hypothetical protein
VCNVHGLTFPADGFDLSSDGDRDLLRFLRPNATVSHRKELGEMLSMWYASEATDNREGEITAMKGMEQDMMI